MISEMLVIQYTVRCGSLVRSSNKIVDLYTIGQHANMFGNLVFGRLKQKRHGDRSARSGLIEQQI
jgi:hypothetical protein